MRSGSEHHVQMCVLISTFRTAYLNDRFAKFLRHECQESLQLQLHLGLKLSTRAADFAAGVDADGKDPAYLKALRYLCRSLQMPTSSCRHYRMQTPRHVCWHHLVLRT